MALQVIGAGFGRTGTMSMKVALELLGYSGCYHMVECLPRGPEHWQKWVDALDANPDWDSIFDGFLATVDFPACTSYKTLYEYYPDAKVVLTVRDPQKWFESTQQTIFAPHWVDYLKTHEMGPFIHATIDQYFDFRMHDKDYLIQRFNEHIEQVKADIPAGDLLIFDVKDGWQSLCDFLGKPVPKEPFPAVNDTEATKDIINQIIKVGPQAIFGYAG